MNKLLLIAILVGIPSMVFAKAKTEADVLKVFAELEKKEALFKSDTMKYRREVETFEEKEYLPAVDAMIAMVKKKACTKCLPAYLKSLAEMENSANEEHYAKLMTLIKNSAAALNKSCQQVDKTILTRVKPMFESAFAALDYEGVKGEKLKAVQTSVGNCLVSPGK